MPHIVFDKSLDLELFAKKFTPFMTKEPCIIKINDFFLSQNKNSALVPMIVIGEKNQQFLVDVHLEEQFDLVDRVDPQQAHVVTLNLRIVVRRVSHFLVVIETDCDVAHLDAHHEVAQDGVEESEVEVVILHFGEFHVLFAHLGLHSALQDELGCLEAFLSVEQLEVVVLADAVVHEVEILLVDFQNFASLEEQF